MYSQTCFRKARNPILLYPSNSSDVNIKLVDIKNRLEKEFKNAETYLEKIVVTKISIFVDCLLKCYNPERKIFLRSDLLPGIKKEKIIKKLKKYIQRISECSTRKRSDSTWKKFGKSTIERSKESNDTGIFHVSLDVYMIRFLGLLDEFYRCVYPVFSEIHGFTSNMRNLETNKSFQVC